MTEITITTDMLVSLLANGLSIAYRIPSRKAACLWIAKAICLLQGLRQSWFHRPVSMERERISLFSASEKDRFLRFPLRTADMNFISRANRCTSQYRHSQNALLPPLSATVGWRQWRLFVATAGLVTAYEATSRTLASAFLHWNVLRDCEGSLRC